MKIAAIVAMDAERGIGKAGALPWRIPEDLKRFAALTTGHTVLMGRVTYLSLPPKFRPLPKRRNIVVTRTPASFAATADLCASIPAAMEVAAKGARPGETLWVIGGAQVYRETQHLWDEVYLTLVDGTHGADVFFPEFEADFEERDREPHAGFTFVRYVRKSLRKG